MRFPASSYGLTTTSNDVMIGYLRSSPTQYPSIAVVNFDGTNWSGSTIVKEGQTYVDLSSSTNERWGDYIGMQRRFNATLPTVWMIGQYGDDKSRWIADTTADYSHNWSAWIAEIGDQGVGLKNLEEINNILLVSPNPSNGVFHIQSKNSNLISFKVLDLKGAIIAEGYIDSPATIDLSHIKNGFYSLQVKSIYNSIHYAKVIINH